MAASKGGLHPYKKSHRLSKWIFTLLFIRIQAAAQDIPYNWHNDKTQYQAPAAPDSNALHTPG